MATQIQRRRGTTAQHSSFTGALAETTIDIDKNTLVVHDGSTAGGHPLAKESGSTLASTTLTSPVLNTGVSGTAVLDEDDMASDSASQLATQQSIKAYTDAISRPGMVNKIINGNFDIWQRGTGTFINAGYGADRFYYDKNGNSFAGTQQSFTLGQTNVPGEPKYYSRTVVTAAAAAANFISMEQRVEGVRSLAGKTVAVSFYAKADASKNIATEFYQDFGTGGSPSSDVTAIGVTTHALTTSWQKFTATATITSISGKTLGTGGDDYLSLVFWFDAGTDFDARTNSLGNQNGTFEIAQVQVEEGGAATGFDKRHVETETALCKRYYEKLFNGVDNSCNILSYQAAAQVFSTVLEFTTEKRTPPTMAVVGTWTVANCSQPVTANATETSYQLQSTITGLGAFQFTNGTASSQYITVDAEL